MAAAQRAGAGGEGVGRGPPGGAGLPGGQRVLVVCDGRGHRRAGHPAADLPRRRAQVAGLLHPPARAARPAGRRARATSRSSRTGGRARGSPPRPGSPARPGRCSPRTGRTCCWSTCRTWTTTCSASARAATGPRPPRPSWTTCSPRCWTPASPPGRSSWCSPSTASRRSPGRSTSTGRCAGPDCWRCTPRPVWNTWTRGRPGPSRWPTTRWRTSTSATRPRSLRSGPCWPGCPASSRCWTVPARRPPASTTRGPGSWSAWPSRTRGSRTTTGWTTAGRPTSPAASTSTASPATTRPSSSSTRPTGW